MNITIEYSKLIRIDNYASNSVIEVPDNCAVRDFLALLKLPSHLRQSVIVLVNDEPAWASTILQENDIVKLNSIITGG
jgi:sulfur carrier protein ThiS